MNKYLLNTFFLIVLSIIIILLPYPINAEDNYIIDNDIVYIDDENVYLSAQPHTIYETNYVYFNLTSKNYNGNIDVAFGFNTSLVKPKKAELYNSNTKSWKNFPLSFTSLSHSYKNCDKWFYIKDVPIISNKNYNVRVWLEIPISTNINKGKYLFAVKPSFETIQQSIDNNRLYVLDPWFNTSWNNRFFVSYNHSAVSGIQNNIPIQYYFSGLIGLNDNGGDIRITYENGTQAPREIEIVNSIIGNGTIFLLSNLSDNGFWFYYNNSDVSEPLKDSLYGSQAVWNTNYIGVWHMNTYNPLLDSTLYNHDGVKGSGIDATNLVNSDTGYGKGINFEDTVNDKFTITHTTDLNINHNTIEMYGTHDTNPNDYPAVLMKVGAYGMFKFKSSDATYPSRLTSRVWKSGIAKNAVDIVPMSLNSPYYWVNKYDGTDEKLYFESIERGSIAVISPIDTNTNNLIIGIYPAAGEWYGIVSEIRLSKIARSTNYINTTYKNLKNPTAIGINPFYNFTGDLQYYTNTLHYNITNNYNHTIESDGTIIVNRSLNEIDNTNWSAKSTNITYWIFTKEINNTGYTNFTIKNNNLNEFTVKLKQYSYYSLNNSSLITIFNTNQYGINTININLIPDDYYINFINQSLIPPPIKPLYPIQGILIFKDDLCINNINKIIIYKNNSYIGIYNYSDEIIYLNNSNYTFFINYDNIDIINSENFLITLFKNYGYILISIISLIVIFGICIYFYNKVRR